MYLCHGDLCMVMKLCRIGFKETPLMLLKSTTKVALIEILTTLAVFPN